MKTPVGLTPKNYRRHSKQSGQAIVLILMLTLAGLVGGVALYSTGILTSEKMQLQNAADASAYSVSVVEARDLNFTAYMNRGMVGNEVAIGQMVSMMSWGQMMRSMPEFLEDYGGKIDGVAAIFSLGSTTGKVIGAVQKVTKPMRKVASPVFKVTQKFTKAVATGISILNQIYSGGQQLFHLLSFIFSASTLFEMKDNNSDGAEFSKFGAIALARHFTSYYAGLMGSLPLYGFVQGYSSGNDGDKEGMNRLAQVVNDTRDSFTENRKCFAPLIAVPPVVARVGKLRIPLIGSLGPFTTTVYPPGWGCYDKENKKSFAPYNEHNGGWLGNIFGFKFDFAAYIGEESLGTGLSIDGYFRFDLGIDRLGGSHLREEENDYSWSGADTIGPKIFFGGSIEICGEFLGVSSCDRVGFDIDVPAPPFGVGAALAGPAGGTKTNPKPNLDDIPSRKEDRDIMYGRASKNFLAWDFVIPATPYPPGLWLPLAETYDLMQSVKYQMGTENRNINKNYKLRRYQDTEDKQAISTFANTEGTKDWISGLEAPYLLIGLIKEDAVKDSQMSKGVFELDAPKTANASFVLGDTVPFGVIAKSEVYYTRPTDIGAKWFRRSDFGRSNALEEKSNAFNPFWQARLVDTSYIDRNAALTFQHGQLTLPTEAEALLESFKRLLEKLI
jgi:hypothetical protein